LLRYPIDAPVVDLDHEHRHVAQRGSCLVLSIYIVPEDLLKGDPREVISELLRQPAVAAGAILPHARERATKERIAPTKSASTNRPKNTTVTFAPKSFGPPIKCPPETIE
jgi:hypothetical protein